MVMMKTMMRMMMVIMMMMTVIIIIWDKFHIFMNKKLSMGGCDCLVQKLKDIVFYHLVAARFTLFFTLYASFCVQA